MKPAPVQVGDIVRLTKPCAPSLVGCLAEVTSVERDKFSAVVTVPGWRHEEPTRTSFLMRFEEAAWEVAARCSAAVSFSESVSRSATGLAAVDPVGPASGAVARRAGQ